MRNKYNTKWHLVGFLFHIELRCTVNHTSNQLLVGGISGDMEKAFGCADNGILLSKLKFL